MIRESKYIIRKIIIGVGIALCLTFINSCEVHAEEVVPRYVQVDGSYLYQDGRIKSGGKVSKSYGQDATIRWTFNISPSYYVNMSTGEDASMYYATIKICTTQPYGNVGSYWQSGGQGYSEIIGVLETTNACTTNNYNGHYFYVYVKLVDFQTPSGGADFSWSPFAFSFWYGLASGQYSQVQDVYLSDSNYYSSDKAMYDSLINEQRLIDNQNTTNNKLDENKQAQQETNNILNDSSIPSDSNNKINDIVTSTQSQNANISDLVNFIPNTLQVIINGFNNSCAGGYSLGSLYGTELTIPCINPVDYLGSFLWGVIDSILCLCYLIPLSKFLINKYNDLTSMKNLRWQ